jgi:hypothetical protein
MNPFLNPQNASAIIMNPTPVSVDLSSELLKKSDLNYY